MKKPHDLTGARALTPQHAEHEQTRDMLRELIDYAIVEGAMIKAPHLIHYLQMARLEIDHWRPPCPTCGRPMRDRGD